MLLAETANIADDLELHLGKLRTSVMFLELQQRLMPCWERATQLSLAEHAIAELSQLLSWWVKSEKNSMRPPMKS